MFENIKEGLLTGSDSNFEEKETLSAARKKLRIIYRYFFDTVFSGTYKILKPLVEVTEEGDGIYNIRLMKDNVKMTKVKISDFYPQLFYQIDPLTGLPGMRYF